MPEYNSYNMSPIRRRNPIGMNINAFADAISKLDTKYQQTAQQQSAIDMALAQLPVNAAEDEWRYNLGNDIRNRIDAVENPNDKYLMSVKAAGELLSRPDVIGRIRAQAEYDNFVKQTQARTDIGEDVKDWAIKNNPYTYTDKTDSRGNIIGGSTWAPNRTPVRTVGLNELINQAKAWINADVGGGVTDISVIDENGNPTNDITKGYFGLNYKKNGQWEKLSSEKVQQAINAAIESTPGAKESLQQDYDVAKWKYDNMTPEEKQNLVGSDITDDRGFLLTPQEYVVKKVTPAIAAMQYSKQYSDIEVGDGMTNYYNAMAKAAKSAGYANALGLNMVPAQTLSTPVTIDVSKHMGESYGSLNTSLADLAQLFPEISTSDEWKRCVVEGNYDELSNLINRNLGNKSDSVKEQVDILLGNVIDNGQLVNDYLNTFTGDEKDAAKFALAIQTGSELPTNNKYTTEYVNSANELMEGADYAAFVVQNDDQLQNILNSLQCKNIEELKSKYGLSTTTYDGRTGIVFKNNSRGLPALAEAIANNSDEVWSLSDSHLVLYNADGSVKKDKSNQRLGFNTPGKWVSNIASTLWFPFVQGGRALTGFNGATAYFNRLAQTRHLLDWYNTHTAANAISMQEELFSRSGKVTDTRTLNTLGTKSIQLSDLTKAHDDGQIDDADYNARYKKIEDNTDNQVLMHDYTQGELYAVEGGGSMVLIDNAEERKEIGDRIAAIEPSKLRYQAGDNDYQVGTIISVPAKYDKDGDKQREAINVFVPNLLDSESDLAYKMNTSFRARKRVADAALYGGTIRMDNDYPITGITQAGAVYNGRPISYKQAVDLTDANYIIRDCKTLKRSGQLTAQTALAASKKVVDLRGEYAEGAPGYDVAVQKVLNEIINGL